MVNKEAIKIDRVASTYDNAMFALGCCLYKEKEPDTQFIFKASGDLPEKVSASANVKDLLVNVMNETLYRCNQQADSHPEFEGKLHPETMAEWKEYLNHCYADHRQIFMEVREAHIPADYPEPEDYYSDLAHNESEKYKELLDICSAEVRNQFVELHPFLEENQYVESMILAATDLQKAEPVSAKDYVDIFNNAILLQQFINEGHCIKIHSGEEVYIGGTDDNGHERKDNYEYTELNYTLKPVDDVVPFPTSNILWETPEKAEEIPDLRTLFVLTSVLHNPETAITIDDVPVFENCKLLKAPEEFKQATDILHDLNQKIQVERTEKIDIDR